MKISEIISKVGEENIRVQFINKAMTGIRNTRDGIEVSFLTEAIDPNDVMHNTGKIGLVLWVPREIWEKIAKEA